MQLTASTHTALHWAPLKSSVQRANSSKSTSLLSTSTTQHIKWLKVYNDMSEGHNIQNRSRDHDNEHFRLRDNLLRQDQYFIWPTSVQNLPLSKQFIQHWNWQIKLGYITAPESRDEADWFICSYDVTDCIRAPMIRFFSNNLCSIIKCTHTHTHTQPFYTLCLGLPGWADTKREIHPLTPEIIIRPLSASFICHDS